jgi:hypothetical protein
MRQREKLPKKTLIGRMSYYRGPANESGGQARPQFNCIVTAQKMENMCKWGVLTLG